MKCPECDGQGRIDYEDEEGYGVVSEECPTCEGSGEAKEEEDEIQTRLGLPLHIQPKSFVDLFSYFSRDGIRHWGIYHCNV